MQEETARNVAHATNKLDEIMMSMYKSNKSQVTSLAADFSTHNLTDFNSPVALKGQFTIHEAKAAIQRSVDRRRDSQDQSERRSLLSTLSENSLLIVLGLALSHGDMDLHNEASQHLSSERSVPSQFDLMELALKACIICNEVYEVEAVIRYSNE